MQGVRRHHFSGDSPDANLRRIVTASEGQCYKISTLGEGFELLEAESVVSLSARRGGEEKVRNCLHWGRCNLVDPTEWPKIGLQPVRNDRLTYRN